MGIRRYTRLDVAPLVLLHSLPEVRAHTSDDVFLQRGGSISGMVHGHTSDRSLFLLGSDPSRIVIMYAPLSGVNYAVHIALHPQLNRKKAVKDCLASAEYMFSLTPCRSITAFARTTHPASCMFAAMVGMRRIGVLTRSFLKNGVYVDEVVYQGTDSDYRTAMERYNG